MLIMKRPIPFRCSMFIAQLAIIGCSQVELIMFQSIITITEFTVEDALKYINTNKPTMISRYNSYTTVIETVLAVIDKHLEGQVYKTHIDTMPTNEESYTVILYLNDDYKGGEISFSFIDNPEINNGIVKSKIKGTYPPYHEKNKDLISFWVKPKKFSVVIFPPTYQHTVHEVTGSEKYLVKAFWQTGNNMVKSDIKLNEFEK